MFNDSLAQLAIVATFVQRFILLVKPLYQATKYQRYFDLALSIVVSAILCVSWQIDVFAVAGIVFGSLIWLGAAFTGVLAALGANILNDVLVLLETLKNQKKAELVTKVAVAEAVTSVQPEKTVV